MLRHSVFAVVLVGAAFAGGAVMNGTGLAWFKALASGGPRIVVDSTTPAGPTASAPATPAPKGPPPPSFPSASPPALDLGLALTPPADGTEPNSPPARPVPAVPDPAASAPGPDLTTPPTLEVGAVPDLSTSPTPPTPPKSDPVTRLASAESGEPPSGAARDWSDLRKRLRAAGVARYEITAEVEGRVRFVCVIPVDGLKAVGHQFEADGDDEFQAAEAALRRVTLWRATETR